MIFVKKKITIELSELKRGVMSILTAWVSLSIPLFDWAIINKTV